MLGYQVIVVPTHFYAAKIAVNTVQQVKLFGVVDVLKTHCVPIRVIHHHCPEWQLRDENSDQQTAVLPESQGGISGNTIFTI